MYIILGSDLKSMVDGTPYFTRVLARSKKNPRSTDIGKVGLLSDWEIVPYFFLGLKAHPTPPPPPSPFDSFPWSCL